MGYINFGLYVMGSGAKRRGSVILYAIISLLIEFESRVLIGMLWVGLLCWCISSELVECYYVGEQGLVVGIL